jgi:hypothetical protein
VREFAEFLGPTLLTKFGAVFSIVLTLAVAVVCTSMVFHRLLPGMTVAILAHLRFLSSRLRPKSPAQSMTWLLVYRMASLRRQDVDEQQVTKIIAILQTTALGDFAISTISGAIGEWVATGFERQKTQPARIKYLEDLVDFLAERTRPRTAATATAPPTPLAQAVAAPTQLGPTANTPADTGTLPTPNA